MKGLNNRFGLFQFGVVELAVFLALLCSLGRSRAAELITDQNPLAIPSIGSYGLRVISPTTLELTLITTKDLDPAPVTTWNFVNPDFTLNLPAASQFAVTVNGQPAAISAVGFKRRPIYAPLKRRDLRVASQLYLKLAASVAPNDAVEVTNPSGQYWTAPARFAASADPLRYSPAIHVNQVGYAPTGPKKAMIGYYLGNFGELDIAATQFDVVKASDGSVVYTGTLRQRADSGYTYAPAPYQKVYEADFSAFSVPGEYRVRVAGLGASFSFMIDEGTTAAFARAFALGLFHQRCGTEMGLPFTRHDHGFCHTNLAEVPTMAFAETQEMIASKTDDYAAEPRHTAPRMVSTETSLYPFVRQGKIDVSKGHHDAGDYSKYTINSAGLIHHLVFAADSFAGAGALDNLGIPESADGKSDLLQEAKWEADFLSKMQDTDGGFYFLVYPKTREYEDDVTPDHGDAQVVWPKTTAVTAAATGALAEIASSPRFKQQFPTEAAAYLAKAQLGWSFLTNAIARFGKDGSYQKITHYGNEFMHDDELAWAASALFAATGDSLYLAKLKEWLPDPNSTTVRRWDWWRMFEGYGCAIRTYAFAARSGRAPASAMDSAYLAKCEAEILATADDHTRFSDENAYGTSFPDLNKSYRSAGWYFSSERAFDITVAYQISPKAEYKNAVFANFNYEGGCNPVNASYITGLGWKRQRDVVHQAAQNDRQTLPPSGIPQGNITAGFAYLYHYRGELTALTFPADNAATAPYPYYDRYSDSFNTTAEFVVVDEARSLASLSYWMAQSSVATQNWKSAGGQITGLPAQLPVDAFTTISLSAPGVDLSAAQIVWEAQNLEPAFGASYTFTPKFPGDTWVEAEALLPDGRRVFVKTNFVATTSLNTPPNPFQNAPVAVAGDTAAIYHLDGNLADATAKQPALGLSGNARLDISNLGWMASRNGSAVRFNALGDSASATLAGGSVVPTSVGSVSVEAMIYINAFKAYNVGNATILSLSQSWNASIGLTEDCYAGIGVTGGASWSYAGPALNTALAANTWHHLSLRVDKTGYSVRVDGILLNSAASSDLDNWSSAGPVTLQFGDFDGWIDEVVVRAGTTAAPVVAPVPAAPSNLGAVAVSSSKIKLTWNDNSTNETGFAVYRKAGQNGTWSRIANAIINAREFLNSGISPAGVYYYKVQAINAAGVSAFSNETSADTTAPITAPTAPSNVAGAAIAPTQIRLTWMDRSSNEDNFRIYRKAANATSMSVIAIVSANNVSFTDSSALANTSYTYKVGAYNAAGEGSSTMVTVTTPGVSIPSAPTGLTGAGLGASQVQISWADRSANETGFKVLRKTGAAGSYTQVASVGANTTSFTDSGLAPATDYSYKVCAYNLVGASAFSNETSARTASLASDSVTFVNTDTTTGGAWTNKYGAEGYLISGAASAPPSCATITPVQTEDWIWNTDVDDPAALLLPNASAATDRIAACWYSFNPFAFDVEINDGNTHQVAIYCLDWDMLGRVARVDVLDATSDTVLHTQEVRDFQNGVYLVYDLKGSVQIKVTPLNGNGVVSGIFFGGISSAP